MALEKMPDDVASDDGVHYPVSDGMGESSLQLLVISMLIELLRDYFASREHAAFVSGNQFFYYKRGDPKSVVAPDVYTIDGESLPPWGVRSWKTWEHGGKAPTLVIEVVSREYGKDYSERAIERYEQLGVREVVRYDPEFAGRRRRERFAHFVRDERGRLVRQVSGDDRVRLVSYDLWVVRQNHDLLRIGVGPQGASLWPTAHERAVAAEEARAALEVQARAQAEAAEAEVARLRAELAALRGER